MGTEQQLQGGELIPAQGGLLPTNPQDGGSRENCHRDTAGLSGKGDTEQLKVRGVWRCSPDLTKYKNPGKRSRAEMVGTVTPQNNLGQRSAEQGKIHFYLLLAPQAGLKPWKGCRDVPQVLLGEAWGAAGSICISTVLPALKCTHC